MAFGRWITLLLLSASLCGCGFQLRGFHQEPVWLARVAIIVNSAEFDIQHQLAEGLRGVNVLVSPDPSQASYWLIIEQDKVEQQITSISSSTTPRQHALQYTVLYKLQRANGQELIPETVVKVSHQWTENSDRILGSNDEAETIKHEMRQEAVTRIIHQLSKIDARGSQ
jgi:LPS-assembly lipoprotein